MMSIIVATVAAPAIAARDPRPRRGLGRMILFLFAFDAMYLAYIALIHARYYAPPW